MVRVLALLFLLTAMLLVTFFLSGPIALPASVRTLTTTPLHGSTGPQFYPIACYYLTNADPSLLLQGNWTVVILEPEEVNASLVAALKARGALVLAYINVGYAEEWRSYWPSIASEPWVHEQTPYEGEHFIKYWRPRWLSIVVSLAREYLDQGFQGVYLDNVDAAVILEEMRPSWAAGVDPREAMIGLICNVSAQVKSLEPDAKVYVNIGSAVDMLYDEKLLSSIDGVLREELWYTLADNGTVVPQDPAETREALSALLYARSHGKAVIVADPVADAAMALELCRKAWSYDFIPLPQPAEAYDYSRPPYTPYPQSR